MRKSELDKSMSEKGGTPPKQEDSPERLKIEAELLQKRFEGLFQTTDEWLAARNTEQRHQSEEDGQMAYEEHGIQLTQDQEDEEKKPEDAELIFTEPNNSGESEPNEPNELREDEIECDNCGENVTRAAKCPRASVYCQHFS